MELVEECRVNLRCLGLRVESIVIGVVGDLVSVKRGCRHLDWATEAEIVIALVVSKQLDLALRKLSRVHGDFIVHRQRRRGRRIFVSDHEEVEEFLRVVLNDLPVDDGAWPWVDDLMSIVLFKQSRGNAFVDEHVENLRVIVGLERFDGLKQLTVRSRTLKLKHFMLEGRTADAVTEDDNLARSLPSAFCHEVLKCL